MRSNSRHSSNRPVVAAQTAGKKVAKEITLDDLLSSKAGKSMAQEPPSRGYTSSFSRAANLGRARPAMAAPPLKGSNEKKSSLL